MVAYRIHYEIGDYQDYFDVEAETTEETRPMVKEEMEKRGLDAEKNNCWSEEI